MRRSSSPQAAARREALVVVMVAAVLAVRGVCGDVTGAVPQPPATLLGSARVTRRTGGVATGVETGGRRLAGAGDEEEEEDYGYVDPPPDTNHRGAGAPIPHN